MNKREEMEHLHKKISQLKEEISRCSHDYSNPIYDPEIVKEGYGSVQDGAGSDPHWSYAGYHDVKKDRWSKECKLCGNKVYTYKLEPVIKSYEPKF